MSIHKQEIFEKVFEEELIPAAVSALFLYREAHQLCEDPSKKSREAKEVSTSMANILSTVFFIYNRVGRASDFFSLVSSRIEQEPEFENASVFGPILLRAIAEGMSESSESKPEKEGVFDNVYVATVGRNNVGKGVVTEYLERKYGFRAYPLSDRVREIALASGFAPPHDRDVLIRVGKNVKEIFNAAVLIRYAITLFSNKKNANMLLFDGLRVEEEATGIKELASDNTKVVCISIVTGAQDDLRERYRRALGRGGPKDPQEDTPEEFDKFCQLDAEEALGIEAAMALSDYEIINRTGDLGGTFAQVDTIMKEMGIKPIDEQAFDLARENLPQLVRIQYIGTESGETRLENKNDKREFGLGHVYAVLIQINGKPQFVHLLSDIPEDISCAIEKMIRDPETGNPRAQIKKLEKLNEFDLYIDYFEFKSNLDKNK